MSSGSVEAELAPEGAFCALHPEIGARFVCTRCGSYACETCSTATRRGLLCRACLELVKAEQPQHLGEASTLQRVANLFIDVWVGAVGFMFVFAVLFGLLGVEGCGPGALAQIGELHAAFADHDCDLQLATQRFHVATQRGNAVIRSALQPRQLGLCHVRTLSHLLLCQLEALPQLAQCQRLELGLCARRDALARFRCQARLTHRFPRLGLQRSLPTCS